MSKPPSTPRDRAWWLFAIFAIAALCTYAIGLYGEFLFGHLGWCAARRGVAGLNFLKYGFAETGFGPVENYGWVNPKQFDVYWHHPPGMHLLIGGAYVLFGAGEWQTRLVPLLVMMVNAALFYQLSRRWWRGAGLVAALAFFLSIPMLGVYGPFVAQETLTLCACLGITRLWIAWRETGRRRHLVGSFILSVLAAWSDWPWFVFVGLLGVVELGRLVSQRSRDLRWLTLVTLGSVLGAIGVFSHLVVLQGAEDPLQGFLELVGHRAGGESEPLWLVLQAGGHRWIELFTPTLVTAGLAWFALLIYDGVKRQLSSRHVLALLCLLTGAIWVVIFRQGARIHEYWPFYAAPFFVIAGADITDRLARALARSAGPQPWARALTTTLVICIIGAQTLAGYAGVMGRHVQPDRDNPHQSEDYRHRHTMLGKWLGLHTAPRDTILFESSVLYSHFQVGYYADRKQHRVHVHDRLRKLPKAPRSRWTVLDLRTMPPPTVLPIVRNLVANHPITVLADFVIADTEILVDRPEVTYLRVVRSPADFWHRWLVSMVYDPYHWEEDPLLEAEFLMYARQREAAIERYVVIEAFPDDLRHRVADHNLAVMMGLETTDPQRWIRPTMSLPEGFNTPPDFGGKARMLGGHASYAWRYAVEYAGLYQVTERFAPGWRPYIHRVSAERETPEIRDQVMPQHVWLFPTVDGLKEGQIAHLQGHFGLNRAQTGTDLRWGFWKPATATTAKRFLRVDGHDWIQATASDMVPDAALPWYLAWLDFSSLAPEEHEVRDGDAPPVEGPGPS